LLQVTLSKQFTECSPAEKGSLLRFGLRAPPWRWEPRFMKASSLASTAYDDDRNPYVYAQTRREFLQLDAINMIARSGAGTQTSIAVMSPDYWPLPWYLRDYAKAGYYGRISEARARYRDWL
jgi:predicted membrane-bound mannosyltransferase